MKKNKINFWGKAMIILQKNQKFLKVKVNLKVLEVASKIINTMKTF